MDGADEPIRNLHAEKSHDEIANIGNPFRTLIVRQRGSAIAMIVGEKPQHHADRITPRVAIK